MNRPVAHDIVKTNFLRATARSLPLGTAVLLVMPAVAARAQDNLSLSVQASDFTYGAGTQSAIDAAQTAEKPLNAAQLKYQQDNENLASTIAGSNLGAAQQAISADPNIQALVIAHTPFLTAKFALDDYVNAHGANHSDQGWIAANAAYMAAQKVYDAEVQKHPTSSSSPAALAALQVNEKTTQSAYTTLVAPIQAAIAADTAAIAAAHAKYDPLNSQANAAVSTDLITAINTGKLTVKNLNPNQIVALKSQKIEISGSNLVATGGGNLVATGGGNVVGTSGGTLVATGGGNAVPPSAPGLATGAAPSLIPAVPATGATGGTPSAVLSTYGNGVVGTGAAPLISNDGSTVVSNDGHSLISNDGSTVVSNDGHSLISNDGSTLLKMGAAIVSAGGGNAVSKITANSNMDSPEEAMALAVRNHLTSADRTTVQTLLTQKTPLSSAQQDTLKGLLIKADPSDYKTLQARYSGPASAPTDEAMANYLKAHPPAPSGAPGSQNANVSTNTTAAPAPNAAPGAPAPGSAPTANNASTLLSDQNSLKAYQDKLARNEKSLDKENTNFAKSMVKANARIEKDQAAADHGDADAKGRLIADNRGVEILTKQRDKAAKMVQDDKNDILKMQTTLQADVAPPPTSSAPATPGLTPAAGPDVIGSINGQPLSKVVESNGAPANISLDKALNDNSAANMQLVALSNALQNAKTPGDKAKAQTALDAFTPTLKNIQAALQQAQTAANPPSPPAQPSGPASGAPTANLSDQQVATDRQRLAQISAQSSALSASGNENLGSLSNQIALAQNKMVADQALVDGAKAAQAAAPVAPAPPANLPALQQAVSAGQTALDKIQAQSNAASAAAAANGKNADLSVFTNQYAAAQGQLAVAEFALKAATAPPAPKADLSALQKTVAEDLDHMASLKTQRIAAVASNDATLNSLAQQSAAAQNQLTGDLAKSNAAKQAAPAAPQPATPAPVIASNGSTAPVAGAAPAAPTPGGPVAAAPPTPPTPGPGAGNRALPSFGANPELQKCMIPEGCHPMVEPLVKSGVVKLDDLKALNKLATGNAPTGNSASGGLTSSMTKDTLTAANEITSIKQAILKNTRPGPNQDLLLGYVDTLAGSADQHLPAVLTGQLKQVAGVTLDPTGKGPPLPTVYPSAAAAAAAAQAAVGKLVVYIAAAADPKNPTLATAAHNLAVGLPANPTVLSTAVNSVTDSLPKDVRTSLTRSATDHVTAMNAANLAAAKQSSSGGAVSTAPTVVKLPAVTGPIEAKGGSAAIVPPAANPAAKSTDAPKGQGTTAKSTDAPKGQGTTVERSAVVAPGGEKKPTPHEPSLAERSPAKGMGTRDTLVHRDVAKPEVIHAPNPNGAKSDAGSKKLSSAPVGGLAHAADTHTPPKQVAAPAPHVVVKVTTPVFVPPSKIGK